MENDGEESLGESFLIGGEQYVVQDEGDDSLGGGMDSDGGDDSKDGDSRTEYSVREQDRFLPIANVARIMKKAIPKSGKIAKDARECVQECLSEFISFITSEASDRCHQEKRKTINGEDILFAMSTLGFDNYVEPLKLYLQKYREAMKGDRASGGGGSDSQVDDVIEDTFSAQALLTADQDGGQNVIYTTNYPAQVSYVL